MLSWQKRFLHNGETSLKMFYKLLFARNLYFLAPVFLALADIALVAKLGHVLARLEEFLTFIWICLENREETDFAAEEVLELSPVWDLGVERERILAFLCQLRIISPEMPVTALNGIGLLCLTASHATLNLQTVVDTRSVGDDERWAGIASASRMAFRVCALSAPMATCAT